MTYYKPTKVDYKPYLRFDAVSLSDEELIERGLGLKDSTGKITTNTGVFSENDLPKVTNGIYLKDIDSKGNLIDRDASVIDQAKFEYKVQVLKEKTAEIDKETQAKFTYFEFDGHKFSLSEKAQLNWGQLMSFKLAGWFGESQPITTYDDKTYILILEKIDGFMQKYALSKMTILSKGRQKKETLIKTEK